MAIESDVDNEIYPSQGSPDGSVAWLERNISKENVRSYVRAAFDLYEELVKLEDNGFEAAVFPSRGTTPFKTLLNNAHLSGFAVKHYENPVSQLLCKPFGNTTITLPFTSDPPGNCKDGSSQVRDYWVRVLRAILEHDLNSPELRYYQFCLERLFGFSRLEGLPVKPAGKRFVFIDTVVSGRAICEIVSSFMKNGLNDFYLILLVDENGAKIKSEFRKIIEEMVLKGKARLIMVNLLFTEDQGPAFTKTWCISAPQFVKSGSNVIDCKSSGELVGTAVSFVRVQYGQTLDNVTSTRLGSILNQVLDAAMSELLMDRNSASKSTEYFEFCLSQLLSVAAEYRKSDSNPLSNSETRRIAENAINAGVSIALGRSPIQLPVVNIEASGSHVVRLYFNDRDVDLLLREFKVSKEFSSISIHE